MLIHRFGALAVAALFVAACCGEGACTVPHLINYQGVVTDASGVVISGAHTLTFGIYAEPEDITSGALWTEVHAGVVLEDGLFNVILGSVTTLPENLFSYGGDRYIGVKVDGGAEMRPRMLITSVPWAYKAGLADSALAAPGAAAGWTIAGNTMYSTVSGNVGIGVTSPLAKLHVRTYNILLPQTATYGEDMIVEASDAVLGLYSNNGGSYGSAITLGELDNTGALANKWSMYRTTGASSRLSFSFGTDSSYAANPVIMSLRSTGVGIGTGSPARKLEINDTQAYLRLTSSSAQGSVLELKSTPTDPGTWRGKINFINGSNATEGAIEYYALGFMDQPGMLFKAGGATRLFLNSSNGYVGMGTTTPEEKLHVVGTVKCEVLKLTGGSDIAEPFDVNEGRGIVEGTVLVIDPDSPGNLKVSAAAYDRRVAGIVSGAGAVRPGLIMSQEGSAADGKFPVALTGRVYCLADASNGPIEPGDLLTTSGMPGHAMKVTDHARAQGAVLGKAMTSLKEGTGLVLVLVSLQ
jgi:hypothetical protein